MYQIYQSQPSRALVVTLAFGLYSIFALVVLLAPFLGWSDLQGKSAKVTPLREGLLVADEVARSLRSRVINAVRRTDEPPSLAVPIRHEMASALAGPTDSTSDSPLALRLQTVNAKLTGKHRSSRSRALCVEIQATVIRTFDGQELYSRAICYRSSSKNLKDWATADAKLFREELEACSRQTAQALSNEMLERGFVTEAVGHRQ